jgi:hypothetical protein
VHNPACFSVFYEWWAAVSITRSITVASSSLTTPFSGSSGSLGLFSGLFHGRRPS